MRLAPGDDFEEGAYTALNDGEKQVPGSGDDSFEEDGVMEEVGSASSEPVVKEAAVWDEIKEFAKLVWPVALTSVVEFVPSLVSIAFVGRFCDRNALDGAALGTMYFNVAALSIGIGLTSALDTLAPQAVGAGKDKLLGVYVQRGGLILGVALIPLAVMAVFAGPLLQGLGQPAVVASRAGQYVRWNLFSLPCYWSFELVRKVFHAFAQVRPLVAIGVLSTLVHCALAYIFVATNLFFGVRFGFVGAALARSVSMFVALVMLCAYSHFSGLSRRWWSGFVPLNIVSRDVKLFLQLGGAGCAAICFEWRVVRHILTISCAHFCRWAFEILALLSGLLPRRPDVYIGAHAVLFNLAALFYMGLMGAGSAASVRTGIALGQGDPARAKLAVRVALAFGCAFGLSNAIVIYSTRDFLPALFANDRAIRHTATLTMPALCIYQVFDAWNTVSGGVMRGAGRQEIPAFIMLAAYYVFGIPAAIVLSLAVFDLRLVGLWAGLTFGLVFASVFLAATITRLDWKLLAKDAVDRARSQADQSNAYGDVPQADNRDSTQIDAAPSLEVRQDANLLPSVARIEDEDSAIC